MQKRRNGPYEERLPSPLILCGPERQGKAIEKSAGVNYQLHADDDA